MASLGALSEKILAVNDPEYGMLASMDTIPLFVPLNSLE